MRLVALMVVVLSAILVVMCFPTVAMNKHTENAHWATLALPFHIDVLDATDWNIEPALAQWEKSGVVKFNIIDATGIERNPCPHQPGMIIICNADYGDTGWFGETESEEMIWKNQRHLNWATIKLNDFYPIDSTNVPGDKYFDESGTGIACHEIGHALGMIHQNDDTSCMMSPEGSDHPNEADIENLRRIYSETDQHWCSDVPEKITCLD